MLPITQLLSKQMAPHRTCKLLLVACLLAVAVGAKPGLAIAEAPSAEEGAKPAASLQAEAAAFIASLGRSASDIAKLDQTALDERRRAFGQLLADSMDLPTIAKLSLGRHWRTASDEQKSEFLAALAKYVVAIYTRKLDVYTGEELKIVGTVPWTDNIVTVETLVIRGSGQLPISVDWRVVRTAEGYRVVDVVVEKVSMLATQRSDFVSVLDHNSGSIAVLIQYLNQRIEARPQA